MHVTIKWHAGSIVDALWQRIILHGIHHSRFCLYRGSPRANWAIHSTSWVFFYLASTLWLEHLLLRERSEKWVRERTITKALGWLLSNPTRECLTCDWHHKSSCNGTEGRTQLMIVVTGIRGLIPNYRTLLLLIPLSGCVCALIPVAINYVGPSPRRLATWFVKRFSRQTTSTAISILLIAWINHRG